VREAAGADLPRCSPVLAWLALALAASLTPALSRREREKKYFSTVLVPAIE